MLKHLKNDNFEFYNEKWEKLIIREDVHCTIRYFVLFSDAIFKINKLGCFEINFKIILGPTDPLAF